MRNLTLHPLWHTFMPVYMHSVGISTHAFSAFAFYLMLTKTPEGGRHFARYMMVLQATITLVDFNIGFLFCPISLQPLPGGLCNGVLCTVFGASGHIGVMLLGLTVANVVVALLYCFHYKFLVILEMTRHYSVSPFGRVTFRAFIFVFYNATCLLFMAVHPDLEGGAEFVRKMFVIGTTLGAFFVFASFQLLSQQNLSFSEKTRQLQRKMMWLLIVQAFAPLTVQAGPCLLFGYSMMTGAFSPDINNVIFCVQLTHAFLHTSVLILTTPSYRKSALYWRKQPEHAIIISTIKTNSRSH